jgi:PAS domain S-box-containing protein
VQQIVAGALAPVRGSIAEQLVCGMSEIIKKSAEQEGAEADVDSFRKDLGPFVVAAETTRMAMVFTDAKEADNPIIFANDSFLSLTGYAREEVLGQSFNFLMARGADAETMSLVNAAFERGSEHDPEIHYRRKDGSEFWASVFISPVRDESGDVVQHFVSLIDLTKHKRAHTQAKLLIDELNHRVKNTLATVQSIVWQAFRNSADPAAIRESIEGRIFALSRSHDLLTRENWESAGLLDLIKEALEPFGIANGRAERFVIAGSNIRLPPKVTLTLGVAFHELATNAVKYGAFSNETGSISIRWAIEPAPEGDRIILHWRESDGPRVTPPSRKGFGSQVVERGLAHELEGSAHLDYQMNGLICTINIPVRRDSRGG